MNMIRLILVTLAILPWNLSCSAQSVHPTDPDVRTPDTSLSIDSERVPRTIVVYEPMARAWPMRIVVKEFSLQVHRPEFERWEGGRAEGRMAVTVERPQAERDSYGSVKFAARALQKTDGRSTVIDEFILGPSEFPTLPGEVDAFMTALKDHLALRAFLIDTQRLVDDIAIGRTRASTRSVASVPERMAIAYRAHPTILVQIDGEAVLRSVPSTDLMRVINSRALIVLTPADARYYLRAAGTWWEAQALTGPWRAIDNAPAGLDTLLQELMTHGLVDTLEDFPRGRSTSPDILVSTARTELLQTDGPAQYSPIPDTQLLYVTNSPNRIFMELRTQTYYALISGRWYRNGKLAGEGWEYVPPEQLSAEFRRIPSTHSMADVLASIPNTPAAREAVLANQVPRMAVVSRAQARLEVDFDGDLPILESIAGTALERVVNAPIPIIRVPGAGYYALDNGVWYRADVLDGPWTMAISVPAAIYAIPPDSPLHYVTYARVYDVRDDAVITGYTPGYTGSYVTPHNVVVYGPTSCYSPWIGSYWYAAPCGWGFGFNTYFTWYDSWGYWFVPHARIKHHYHRPPHVRPPWWGAWRPATPSKFWARIRTDPSHPQPSPAIVREATPRGEARSPTIVQPLVPRERAKVFQRIAPVAPSAAPTPATRLPEAPAATAPAPRIRTPFERRVQPVIPAPAPDSSGRIGVPRGDVERRSRWTPQTPPPSIYRPPSVGDRSPGRAAPGEAGRAPAPSAAPPSAPSDTQRGFFRRKGLADPSRN